MTEKTNPSSGQSVSTGVSKDANTIVSDAIAASALAYQADG